MCKQVYCLPIQFIVYFKCRDARFGKHQAVGHCQSIRNGCHGLMKALSIIGNKPDFIKTTEIQHLLGNQHVSNMWWIELSPQKTNSHTANCSLGGFFCIPFSAGTDHLFPVLVMRSRKWQCGCRERA